MSDPTAPDSRQSMPLSLATTPQLTNLLTKATTMTQIVQPQMEPSPRSPKSVLSPERAKYCDGPTREPWMCVTDVKGAHEGKQEN